MQSQMIGLMAPPTSSRDGGFLTSVPRLAHTLVFAGARRGPQRVVKTKMTSLPVQCGPTADYHQCHNHSCAAIKDAHEY